jgi:hypothetical protein
MCVNPFKICFMCFRKLLGLLCLGSILKKRCLPILTTSLQIVVVMLMPLIDFAN